MAAAAIQQPGLELGTRGDDRLGGLPEVVDVVQRIVQPEDVDPALRGARDEAAREIAADGPRPDEKAPAHRQRKRRLRPRLEGANPLPWALDTPTNGGVEDAPTRNLQVRETGSIEELREAQQIRRRHQAGERLLAEDADRRIDETRHGSGHYPECGNQQARRAGCSAFRADRA